MNLLGEVEHLVLLAVLRLGESGYGVSIRDEIAERAGVTLSRGTIYVTLDRLERLGYVRSWFTEPTAERGGKAKRCFAIDRPGLTLLREHTRAIERLRQGTSLAPARERS
jgi:PadR family transcriptional regulator, regulatory protein PadR